MQCVSERSVKFIKSEEDAFVPHDPSVGRIVCTGGYPYNFLLSKHFFTGRIVYKCQRVRNLFDKVIPKVAVGTRL
jgi:hypothetical protein